MAPRHRERTWDLSGPTACEVLDPEAEGAVLDRLGPDPLRRDADAGRFVERAARSRRAVGAVLLDQAMVAGIGNVYRAELCFRAGVHPATPARSLGEDVLAAMWDDAVELLRIGERLGRIVTVPASDPGRPPGRIPRGERLHVYRRSHCLVCASPVERTEIAARTSYHCPVCQPGPGRAAAAPTRAAAT